MTESTKVDWSRPESTGTICQRCNLPGAIDLDTGGQYHAELMECVVLQGGRIRELERERGQWQESSGQNYVRAQDAEAERDRLREAIEQACRRAANRGMGEWREFKALRKALENTDGQ